jgi:hypothetical protein
VNDFCGVLSPVGEIGLNPENPDFGCGIQSLIFVKNIKLVISYKCIQFIIILLKMARVM